ncbi:hypothetical protein CVS30_03865 [Arthrobacter psychrolactophilus]|uniref:Uncharacterized protein n=1 Tax=Arthrobacter psychrolactophilus TaxID=92442 RepID=A0A2V5ITG9_9MICC|nr:hypothetical protein CVS30_03865 [Arthrobacter psychrolactophilus]
MAGTREFRTTTMIPAAINATGNSNRNRVVSSTGASPVQLLLHAAMTDVVTTPATVVNDTVETSTHSQYIPVRHLDLYAA